MTQQVTCRGCWLRDVTTDHRWWTPALHVASGWVWASGDGGRGEGGRREGWVAGRDVADSCIVHSLTIDYIDRYSHWPLTTRTVFHGSIITAAPSCNPIDVPFCVYVSDLRDLFVSISVYIFDLRYLILVICLRFRLRLWSPREFRRLCLDYQDVFLQQGKVILGRGLQRIYKFIATVYLRWHKFTRT